MLTPRVPRRKTVTTFAPVAWGGGLALRQGWGDGAGGGAAQKGPHTHIIQPPTGTKGGMGGGPGAPFHLHLNTETGLPKSSQKPPAAWLVGIEMCCVCRIHGIGGLAMKKGEQKMSSNNFKILITC